MSRSRECIHCLREMGEVTRDHVFPASWYPDSTPSTVQRWTVPSCRECNEKHGRNEEDLLLRFGLCLGPDEVAAQGVSDRVMRMIRPELATDERDRRARQKKREDVLREITVHKVPLTDGVFPNFGPQPGLKYDDYAAIDIDGKMIKILAEKIVRGINYKVKDGELIRPDRAVEVFFNNDKEKAVAEVIDLIKTKGKTFHHGPGIEVSRAETVDEPRAVAFHIQIWGRLKMSAAVFPKEFMGGAKGESEPRKPPPPSAA